ncbi:MAG: hypothetical protein Q8L23_03035 [Caulobacter sp.]|nr:hypothetical protein [Caulobacter sp.]
MARTSNYALRLLSSLKAEAEKFAREDGATLNQFINLAVAEKLSALRTDAMLRDRASRADLDWFDAFMSRAGGEPPAKDDMP